MPDFEMCAKQGEDTKTPNYCKLTRKCARHSNSGTQANSYQAFSMQEECECPDYAYFMNKRNKYNGK